MFAKSDVVIPATVDPLLGQILTWPRPHGSESELLFRVWLAGEIKRLTGTEPEVLAHGCLFVDIQYLSGSKATTLFSSHMDTMENTSDGKLIDGKIPLKTLTYDPHMEMIGLAKDSSGGCLGADDGAGIWIMLNMMRAKVPGGYIFHTEEERGGIGARAVLSKHRDLLKRFEVAVAFDRPGDYEVITHQGGVECASEKFGSALARLLREGGLTQYVTSTRGVFTDTKVYRDVIAECTNIGVGYTGQHGRNEDLDYGHLERLNDICVKLNWHSLPVDRDPDEVKVPTYYQGATKPPWPTAPAKTSKTLKGTKVRKYTPFESDYDVLATVGKDELAEYVTIQSEEALQSMMNLMAEIAALRAQNMLLRTLAGVVDGPT